jgi:hypothetical protein
MNTPHEQVRDAIAEVIRGLNLEGLPRNRVYERLTANGSNITYPCVVVSVAGFVEEKERLAFGAWQWTFPVLVLFAHRGDPKDPGEEAPYFTWRDLLSAKLEELQELPGVDGFHDIEVQPGGNVTGSARGRTEPGQTTDPLGPAWLKVAGALTARVKVVLP